MNRTLNIWVFYSMLVKSQFVLRVKNSISMVVGELRRQVKVTITEVHEKIKCVCDGCACVPLRMGTYIIASCSLRMQAGHYGPNNNFFFQVIFFSFFSTFMHLMLPFYPQLYSISTTRYKYIGILVQNTYNFIIW